MIRAGSVFITGAMHRHVDDHLWIVLSDPAQDRNRVLIVNLTTCRGYLGHDDCVLRPAGYDGLDHPSCVLFQGASICTLADLEASMQKGLVELRGPLSAEVLQRVKDAAERTRFLSGEGKQLLREQALAD